MKEVNGTKVQKGNVKAGDGGAKFREQWPELDAENWEWMKEHKIDPITGNPQQDPAANCGPKVGISMPGGGSGSQAVVGAVVEGGREGTSWVARNKLLLIGSAIFLYVLVARLVGEGSGKS
jgi:ubiquitin-conjugating enzyme E2 J2